MGRPNERLETRSIYCPRRCATRAPYPRQPSDPDRRVGGTVFESHLRARANFVKHPRMVSRGGYRSLGNPASLRADQTALGTP